MDWKDVQAFQAEGKGSHALPRPCRIAAAYYKHSIHSFTPAREKKSNVHILPDMGNQPALLLF
eukprot:382271-Amorphochlora_amoeboformis.AAC.1